MKHLKTKTKRARLLQGISKYARGVILGAVGIVCLNSIGYVVQINIMPNSILMTSEAMK